MGIAALSLLGLTAGLLAAEAGLRIVGYQGEHERLRTVFDRNLGQIPRESWVHEVLFDPDLSDGVEIRGQRMAFKKSPGRTRVIFAGDSGTQGAGVDVDEAFPAVFGQLVGETDGIEVLNAGVIGMSTVSEYRLVADQLLRMKPDIVVVGVFMANDINFNIAHEHLLRDSPFSLKRGSEILRQRSVLAHFAYLQGLSVRRSINFFTQSKSNGGPFGVWPPLFDDQGVDLLHYRDGEVGTYRKEYSAKMNEAFDLLREVFSRFKDLSDERGFQFVVVTIPTSSDIAGRLQMFAYPDALAEMRDFGVIESEEDLDFRKPARRVAEICGDLGIVCIDPIVEMRLLGAETVIRENDDHLSVAGHRTVARVLAERFARRQRRFENRFVETDQSSVRGVSPI